MPEIPAAQEVEIWRIQAEVEIRRSEYSLGKKSWRDPISTNTPIISSM